MFRKCNLFSYQYYPITLPDGTEQERR